jgi:hypothetical protein
VEGQARLRCNCNRVADRDWAAGRAFHLECSGFGYQAELLTRLISEGAAYKEIPVVAYDRKGLYGH